MKKIVSGILALLMIFSILCGCGNNGTQDEQDNEVSGDTYETNINLAYSKNDSLNPLECKSVINYQIGSLVFQGLYSLDEKYEPKKQLAVSDTAAGTFVSVTLGDFVYSDGTSITPEDVVSSFEKAKESSAYSGRLENFVSASVASENSVKFTLERNDPYALSCLDFPIVKVDENSNFPIGSGRYKFEKSGDNVYLIVNTKNTGFNPVAKTIKLVPVYDSESVESSIVIGDTAFCYNDISDGDYTRLNAHTVDMGINSFVYLGINKDSSFLSNVAFRKAINYCIDRDEIISSAFRSHARKACIPFNPDWYALGSQSFDFSADKAKAKSIIEDAGADIKSGQITLLYCTDNCFKSETGELIAGYLKDLGFSVYVKAYSLEAFEYDFEMGAYDIYLGEIKMTNNMDLKKLIEVEEAEQSETYNLHAYDEYENDDEESAEDDSKSSNLTASERYSEFLAGKCELIDFINTFSDDVPLIPICYRNALVSYTNALTADYNPHDTDVFCDIETWSIK